MHPPKQHGSIGIASGLLLALLIASTAHFAVAEDGGERQSDFPGKSPYLAQANGAGDTTQKPTPVADFCYNDDSIGSCTSNCRQFRVMANGGLIPGSCAQTYYCTQNIDPCE